MTKAGYKPEKTKERPDSGGHEPTAKKNRNKKRFHINGVALFSCMVFLFSVLIAIGVITVWKYTEPYQSAFLPGCKLMGQALDGLTPEQGRELLRNLTGERIKDWKAEVSWQESAIILTADQINLSVDEEATLSPLWAIGRNDGMLLRFWSILTGRFAVTDVQPVVLFDEAKIRDETDRFAKEIDREAVLPEVKFTPADSEPFEFTDEAVGYRLDAESLAERIIKAARSLDPLSEEANPIRTEPAFYRNELENATVLRARIKDELGTGAAAENAALALQILDGVQIGPGESWSFNRTIGPRTAEAGYMTASEQAYGRDAKGVGGGVCLASTLLYKLALMAGLDISERHAAAYVTDYAPAGEEAAVSDQGLDLVFVNNTGLPVWMRARIWEEEDRKNVDLQMIGLPMNEKIVVTTDSVEIPAPEDPVFIRDRDGKYAVYTDEQIAGSQALPGFRVITSRAYCNLSGVETGREVISEDVYEPIPARIYVGMQER